MIPKGQPEAVNGRKTDNIMAKDTKKGYQKKDRQYNGNQKPLMEERQTI